MEKCLEYNVITAAMILSDRDILQGRGASIQPFREKNLTPNGYDLTVAEVYMEDGQNIEKASCSVPPGAWFAVSTEEYVKLETWVSGSLWIRTSWARKGVISSFGMVDAGFEGTLTLSALNASAKPLPISPGDRFAQIVMHALTGNAEDSYASRSGNYQGQRGVTLSRE